MGKKVEIKEGLNLKPGLNDCDPILSQSGSYIRYLLKLKFSIELLRLSIASYPINSPYLRFAGKIYFIESYEVVSQKTVKLSIAAGCIRLINQTDEIDIASGSM
ncbi:MAG: hypothetical protein EZS28_021816 [Streblomastix strix]|uniref:Uncharacterized protein n=1 Tax=Streblomastix strix TaxID=222440 RepID=A0A5J4VJI4_9EUKA|nr:MAG: hypothetical protein EZS28_021816 [Streblomastix strix]